MDLPVCCNTALADSANPTIPFCMVYAVAVLTPMPARCMVWINLPMYSLP